MSSGGALASLSTSSCSAFLFNANSQHEECLRGRRACLLSRHSGQHPARPKARGEEFASCLGTAASMGMHDAQCTQRVRGPA
jgi:hypothetical protein